MEAVVINGITYIPGSLPVDKVAYPRLDNRTDGMRVHQLDLDPGKDGLVVWEQAVTDVASVATNGATNTSYVVSANWIDVGQYSGIAVMPRLTANVAGQILSLQFRWSPNAGGIAFPITRKNYGVATAGVVQCTQDAEEWMINCAAAGGVAPRDCPEASQLFVRPPGMRYLGYVFKLAVGSGTSFSLQYSRG